MVYQGRCAVFDCIHEGYEGGIADGFRIERPVERPPQLFQDLREVPWCRTRDGQAAGKRSIKMRVRANISGHDVLALGIQRSGFGVFFYKGLCRADSFYAFPFDVDGMIFKDAIWRAPGYDLCVSYEHD